MISPLLILVPPLGTNFKSVKYTKKVEQRCHTAIIKSLAQKYNISMRYVRYCLKDERTPVFAKELKADYHRMVHKIVQVIKNKDL